MVGGPIHRSQGMRAYFSVCGLRGFFRRVGFRGWIGLDRIGFLWWGVKGEKGREGERERGREGERERFLCWFRKGMGMGILDI